MAMAIAEAYQEPMKGEVRKRRERRLVFELKFREGCDEQEGGLEDK